MSKAIRFFVFIFLAATAASAWSQLTDTTVATNRAVVPPGTDWTEIFVTCPTGLVALSGGVDTNDFTQIEVTTLAPTFAGAQLASQLEGTRSAADGWIARVKNYDATAHPVTLMAVCASLPGVVVNISSGGVSGGTVAAAGTGTAFTNCPVGYSAVGGGVDDSSPATMKISALAPTFQSQFLIERPAGQNPAPTGWSGSIRSEGAAGQMKVAAVCAQLSGVFSESTGPFNIPEGGVSGLSAQCPSGSVLLSGGIDSNEVRRNAIAVSTVMFGSQFPADRPVGTYSGATGWYGIFYNYGPGMTTGAVAAVCALSSPNVVFVYEFYNTNLRHFFRTANAAEANGIDHGSAGAGWVRTGDDFLAYLAQSNSPGFDVCRFYTPGANSHFYTAFQSECDSLKSPNSGWMYEGLSFRIQLPSGSTCPAGTKPVYRLYNNRFQFNDSNHRFTTIQSEVQSLQAQGWTYEGVAFCAIAS